MHNTGEDIGDAEVASLSEALMRNTTLTELKLTSSNHHGNFWRG